MSTLPIPLAPDDQASLRRALEHLETPSYAIRLSHVLGTPIEMALQLLPRSWYRDLHRRVEAVMTRTLRIAIQTLRHKRSTGSHDGYYRLAGMATGALGGFFGAPGLFLELPAATTLMLRSIADIARSEGENLDTIESRLACLEVFALGGRSRPEDAADTGYYGLRLALQAPIASASNHIARHGLAPQSGAPLLVNFISTVSRRFGVALSEKAAAELLPVFGAVGGAFVTGVFLQHFQDTARSHFTIRRLERKYTPQLIQAEYKKLQAAA